MRPSDPHLIVALAVLVIFATMVAVATTYGHEARLVPLVIGIPAMSLAGWQVFREVRHRAPHTAGPGTASANQRDESRAASADADRSSDTEPIVWLLLFTGVVLLGGLVAGGTLGVMGCLRIWLRESWRTTATGGAVAIFVLHFCFERGFGMALFGGWLVEWMSK